MHGFLFVKVSLRARLWWWVSAEWKAEGRLETNEGAGRSHRSANKTNLVTAADKVMQYVYAYWLPITDYWLTARRGDK